MRLKRTLLFLLSSLFALTTLPTISLAQEDQQQFEETLQELREQWRELMKDEDVPARRPLKVGSSSGTAGKSDNSRKMESSKKRASKSSKKISRSKRKPAKKSAKARILTKKTAQHQKSTKATRKKISSSKQIKQQTKSSKSSTAKSNVSKKGSKAN